MNYIVGANGISSVPMGMYNTTQQEYTSYERGVMWPGSATKVPIDQTGTFPEYCVRVGEITVPLILP